MFFLIKWLWRSLIIAVTAVLISLPLKSCGVDHFYSDDEGAVSAPATSKKEKT